MSYVKDSMREGIAGHRLAEVLTGDIPITPGSERRSDVRIFQMYGDPLSRMMMVTLIFSPEGIVIYGDLCPRTHGVISALGYGVGWFGKGKLSEGYLCSKFLQTEWVDENVGPHLKQLTEQSKAEPEYHKREEMLGEFVYLHDELKEAIRENTFSFRSKPEVDINDLSMNWYEYERAYGHIVDQYGMDAEDAYPSYGYNRSAAGWLCAIQQRFSQLMAMPAEVKP